MGVITISRQFGSGGEAIAEMVAKETGFLLVNKKMIVEGLVAHGIEEPAFADERVIEQPAGCQQEPYRSYFSALHDFIYDLAIRNDLVLLGRGGNLLFRDFPPSLHVKLVASLASRMQRIREQYSLPRETALTLIKEQDEHKRQYYRLLFNEDWANQDSYDLILNTDRLPYENAASIIAAAYRIHGEPRSLRGVEAAGTAAQEQETAPLEPRPSFMHPSEEEFAKMLDYYRIKWEYEPRSFLLEWDSEGNVAEAFTPDFYLPEQELYIELTTQRQKLVWKKNKKIKRLKELYPEIKIKIIYDRAYRGLLKKFNIDTGGNDRED